MAKRGRKVTFHGAFKSKQAAEAKERQVGGFIKPITVPGGSKRYVVMTRRGG